MSTFIVNSGSVSGFLRLYVALLYKGVNSIQRNQQRMKDASKRI